MLDPDLNPADDVAAMNSGNFTRSGEDIIVNGRTYGMHGDTGTVFPKSGPGIHNVDRAQHQLLKQLGTQTYDNAMKFARNFPGLDDAKAKQVLDIWGMCK